jgi:hypothetical protein
MPQFTDGCARSSPTLSPAVQAAVPDQEQAQGCWSSTTGVATRTHRPGVGPASWWARFPIRSAGRTCRRGH